MMQNMIPQPTQADTQMDFDENCPQFISHTIETSDFCVMEEDYIE
jgi:hypothetical protein